MQGWVALLCLRLHRDCTKLAKLRESAGNISNIYTQMNNPKGSVLLGVCQNRLCLTTPLVPALLIPLHNNKMTLRDKNELLQDAGSDDESLCNTVFLAGRHSKNVCL